MTQRARRGRAPIWRSRRSRQEIAELRRYTAALAQRDVVLGELVALLQARWCEVSGLDWRPADAFLRQLILRYGPEVATVALDDVATFAAEAGETED